VRLVLVQPAGQNGQDELEGLEDHRGIVGEFSGGSRDFSEPAWWRPFEFVHHTNQHVYFVRGRPSRSQASRADAGVAGE
jgi:hypothetical protein